MICKECQSYFESRSNKRYCTRICRDRAKRKRNADYNRHYHRDYKKTYDRSEERRKAVESGRKAWSSIRSRCRDDNNNAYRHVECRLTFEEFREIYFSTDKCSICNESVSDNDRRRDKSARTIDRIDSTGHYEKGNVRVVCRSCNSRIRKEQK